MAKILFALSCLFGKRCTCMIQKDHSRNKRDGYCYGKFPTTTKFDKVMFAIFPKKYYWAVAPDSHFKARIGKYGMYVNHHGKSFGLYFENVPF